MGCTDLKVTLPSELPPVLREVLTYPPGTTSADWCLTERGAKDILYNLEVLRAWGATGQAVIEEYNKKPLPRGRESPEKTIDK